MANPMRIKVIHGRPDETELAAVTAVLIALVRRAAGSGGATGPAYAGWTVQSGGHRPRPARNAP
ncbi:acyl-CoA carboxylase subunit epsilon [Streptomyces sp. NPDC047000]|uniref:acyl-CoA carboxylase subunit epsilon n=1 Tax=Streptomyces sp. NPDC047000 TaxID=3155474 RepID=UPI0033D24750